MALPFVGLNLTSPINRIRAGMASIAQNIRSYTKGSINLRTLLTDAIFTLAASVHSLRRLNDTTNPTALPAGFTLIAGAGTVLYNNDVVLATGFTGNPFSLVPLRPNASPQVWMYQADAALEGAVTLRTQYLGLTSNGPAGTPVNFVTNGMNKVRSDGIIYKMGIKEPQMAPVVSTGNSSTTITGTLLATAIPWTNFEGANSSYDYGETNGFPNPGPTPPIDGTAPFIVEVENASFLTINSITGTATINGASAAPTSSGPVTSTFPAFFIMEKGSGTTPPPSATVVVGAFTDGAGNVIPAGVAPLFIPSVVDVGAAIGTMNGITVPSGAVQFQIGIDSAGNTFSANSGSFDISVTVTTNALPAVVSTFGTLSLAYFGSVPGVGPVGEFTFKSPDDPSGSGPAFSVSQASGTTTGNSFIFDAEFGTDAVPAQPSGIPGPPGITENLGTSATGDPMQWFALSPESVVTGSTAVFATPITTTNSTNTQFANFIFLLTGSIFFPAAGDYTFVITCKDDFIWGIGGGVTLTASPAPLGQEFDYGNQNSPPNNPDIITRSTNLSQFGQTITVASGLPLLPRVTAVWPNHGEEGMMGVSTITVSVPAPGIYPIEFDYVFWFHSGRIFLAQCTPGPGAPTGANAPTIIPPIEANVRQNVQVRYVYRSSATGATSNPSPESAPQTIPVTSNTYTSFWSPDPQVDVVDYYRIDETISDFTFVNTGPNDNLGPDGTNTPVSDSLTDAELGTQLLNFDNFEPVPSIDLPQKGICNISGGVITYVSGGAIGGTETGFNPRWLAGTEILIGSPTSLAFTTIARPVGNTITIPGVPDGSNQAYEIEEPILGAQTVQHMMGPTDNILFAFAFKDPLRPGTLYWSAGNNLDAWPDTNQVDITDPNDALVGGDIAGPLGAIFSVSRSWIIVPNFFNALANVTGVEGSTWTFQKTAIDRALFMEWCVAVEGSNIFFRGADGVYVSARGAKERSITDDSLYPIFPHEGSVPVSIVRSGITVVPPDDTQTQAQRFKIVKGFLYYDYIGIDSAPHTLVFDTSTMGWVWDTPTPAATVHASDDGFSVQGVLAGCVDGSVRNLSSAGTETVTAVVQTGALGFRGYGHCGAVVLEYSSTADITLNINAADEGNNSFGSASINLTAQASLTKVFLRPFFNKAKLLTFSFTTTAPFNLNPEGCIAYMGTWGDEHYVPVQIFSESGGEG
jgi:hypothetical protein